MKYKSKFMLAKTEAVEDTYEVMVGSDAVLTSNLEVQVYQGSRISRDFDSDSLGASEEINVNPHNVLSFDVEAQGSGAAGTEPAYDNLLAAVGLEGTVDAGVSVTYAPISASFETASLGFLRLQDDADQMLIKTTGVLGNMSLNLSAGEFPKFNFSNMMGSYYTPSQISAITAVTSDYVAPAAVTKDNTPTVTLDSVATCMSSFTVDLGNQIARRDAPNCRATILSDRNVTGTITVKAVDLSTKNYFTDLESHATVSTVPIIVVHGTTAGSIITVTLPTAQLSNITQVDVDGDLGFQFDFIGVPTSAGNDEIEIEFT